MSKRLFSFLLALLMVVSLAVPAYAADGAFTLTLSVDDEDKEIQVGDEIAITVGSENSPNNIMVAELRIKADNNKTIT